MILVRVAAIPQANDASALMQAARASNILNDSLPGIMPATDLSSAYEERLSGSGNTQGPNICFQHPLPRRKHLLLGRAARKLSIDGQAPATIRGNHPGREDETH